VIVRFYGLCPEQASASAIGKIEQLFNRGLMGYGYAHNPGEDYMRNKPVRQGEKLACLTEFSGFASSPIVFSQMG